MSGTAHVRWPPERFFWAEVEEPAGAPRLKRRQVHFLAEHQFPLPIEQLKIVSVATGPRQHLVCAVPRTALQELPEESITLTPSRLPSSLGPSVDPATLNLLVGDCLPHAVRRMRRRMGTEALALVCVILSLVLVGAQRRAAVWSQWIRDHRQHVDEAIASALSPRDQALLAGDLPPELVLRARLRELQRTRAPGASRAQPPSSAPSQTLASLLRQWPPGLVAQVEDLVWTPAALNLRVRLPPGEDAAPLLQEPRDLPGWRRTLPGVQHGPSATRVTLRWEPEGGEVP